MTASTSALSVLDALCLALAILWDARERARAARRAGSLAKLTQVERELLTALGADEFKPHRVHRPSAAARVRNDLSRWIERLRHAVELAVTAAPGKQGGAR